MYTSKMPIKNPRAMDKYHCPRHRIALQVEGKKKAFGVNQQGRGDQTNDFFC